MVFPTLLSNGQALSHQIPSPQLSTPAKICILVSVILGAIVLLGCAFLLLNVQGMVPAGINVLTHTYEYSIAASASALAIMEVVIAYIILQRTKMTASMLIEPDAREPSHVLVSVILPEDQQTEGTLTPVKLQVPPVETAHSTLPKLDLETKNICIDNKM